MKIYEVVINHNGKYYKGTVSDYIFLSSSAGIRMNPTHLPEATQDEINEFANKVKSSLKK